MTDNSPSPSSTTELRTIEEPSMEVAAPPSDPTDILKTTRDKIREQLARVDQGAGKLEGDSSLALFWDDLTQFADTNQIILLNIQQVQVMLQDMQQRFWANRIRNQDRLIELANKEDKGCEDTYIKEKNRCEEQEREDVIRIEKLSRIVKDLAKEYRQCAIQKKHVITLIAVHQFRMSVEAAVHRNIRDPETLKAIAADIREAARVLFPIAAVDDY